MLAAFAVFSMIFMLPGMIHVATATGTCATVKTDNAASGPSFYHATAYVHGVEDPAAGYCEADGTLSWSCSFPCTSYSSITKTFNFPLGAQTQWDSVMENVITYYFYPASATATAMVTFP